MKRSKAKDTLYIFFVPNGKEWLSNRSHAGSNLFNLGKNLNILKAIKKVCPELNTNIDVKKFKGEMIKISIEFFAKDNLSPERE